MIRALNQFIQWVDGKTNPITIKEVYQGFRSHIFTVGCAAALFICLFSYISFIADQPNASMGNRLFLRISIMMTLLSVVLIPLTTGMQFRQEITSGTIDLLYISNLTSWQIISGRFQASVLKIILVFAFMGPFAFASFLLGGVGAFYILIGLTHIFLSALLISSINLLAHAIAVFNPKNRPWVIVTIVITLFFAWITDEMSFRYFSHFAFGRSIRSAASSSSIYTWIFMLLVTGLVLKMAADTIQPPKMRSFFVSKILFQCLAIALGMITWFESTQLRLLSITSRLSELIAIVLFILMLMSTFWSGLRQQPSGKIAYLFRDGPVATVLYSTTVFVYFGISLKVNWSKYTFIMVSFALAIWISQLIKQFRIIDEQSIMGYMGIVVSLFIFIQFLGAMF